MVRSKILLGLVIIASVFFFLKKQEEHRLIKVMEADKIALQQSVSDSLTIKNTLELQLTKQQNSQLKSLWKNFQPYTYNGTNNWFSHQNFSKITDKDSLLATINQDGEVALISNYFGNEPLGLYKIQLKIGETLYDSVPILQPNVPLQLAHTVQVHESLYFKAANAKNLIEKIANSADTNIEVRLIGKNEYTSFTLSSEDKKAFAETWELLNLLSV
jgi:hypothetical protein